MKYHRHGKKRLSSTTIVIILVVVVAGYAGLLLGVKAVGSYFENKDVVEPMGSLDGRFDSKKLTMQYGGRTWKYRESDLTNILLIGVDWDKSGETRERYAGQADFLMLITFDKRGKTVSTVQLDRDTMADIRMYGPFGDYSGVQKAQICLSHAYGSSIEENCRNTVWAVSRLLNDIPIDGYLTLDMKGISVLNDALGGVQVTLEEDFTVYDPDMYKGATLTLHGAQAEYYVRGRMQIGDGMNTGRMRRQRTFIRAAEELLVQSMSGDMNYFGALLEALAEHMTTDLDRGWLINKAYECLNYQRPDPQTPAGSHVVGEDGFMEFHVDADALNSLLTTNFFE